MLFRSTYDDALQGLPLELPPPAEPGSLHARHLYTVLADPERCGLTRDRLVAELHDRKIGTGVHYVGQHLQPYYREKYRVRPEDFPNATKHSLQTLSLPLGPNLSDRDLDDVVGALKDVLREARR